MSTKPNDGGPAFPVHPESFGSNGMSLRAYFAGQALPAVIAGQYDIAMRGGDINPSTVTKDVAQVILEYADAIIAELEKESR